MRFGKRRLLKSSEIDLGGAVFDRDSRRALNPDGTELELRHQSREVLAVLADRQGETVTRKTLIDEVWGGRTVADDSVAQCITEIRRVLGDADKRVVETVPREGYRLILPEPKAVRSARWPAGALLGGAVFVIAAFALAYTFLRPSAPAEAPVIAVLPFEDFSVTPHQGYLNDAVAEGIITALAQYSPQLTVISRRSSFQFRDTNQGVSEIAQKLGAGFILEGSQQYDGSVLRVTAQLIDGRSEAHIWADEVDVPMDALLISNSQVSRKIANAVGIKVVDTAEASMTAGDVSALMISNAAQSRIMRSFTRENLLQNIEEQEESIRRYPDSAWGPLGQALSLRIGLRYGWIDGDEETTRNRMYELARRGVELDPNNFFAYHALGRALMFNKDVEAAIGAFRRGVELNPSSSIVAGGLADALIYVGKTDEALEVVKTIEFIDPLYGFNVQWTKAFALWQLERCDEASEAFLSSPSMPVAANKMVAAVHHCLGNSKKATLAMTAYLAENPTWTVSKERDINTGMWTAPGSLDRWLSALEAAGMPIN